ncbi:MAG: ABC transporter substrate-binding protein [Thermoflexales bacterium]|nr:ABC transporter substrate-binding protein [Thermoflexales bacterium]
MSRKQKTVFETPISRRRLLRGIGFGAGAAALAACGQGAAPAAPTSAPVAAPTVVSKPGSVVEVVYWGFSGGVNEKTDGEVAAKFNAAQKDVKVTVQVQGNYEETANKLTNALAAKQAPDMCLLSDVWWFKFMRAKALQPMNDYITAEKLNPAEFVDSLWNEGVRKGVQYWIPYARSTPLFYYNMDMYQAAGFSKAPATWAEYVDMAPKLIKKEGDTMKVSAFAHSNGASYNAWVFMCTAWQFGGGYSDMALTKYMLTDPETVRAAQFMADSVNKAKWAHVTADPQKDFISGLCASAIMSTGSLGGVLKDAQFKVGTAFLPMEKNFGCCTGGSGIGILSTAPKEKAQAAMKFINYMTGTEGGAYFSQNTGYMPVRKTTAEAESYKAFFAKTPQAKTAVDQLPKTRAQDAARVFIPGGDQIIGKGLERIVIGKEDALTVWKDITATLEKEGEPVKKDIAALG